jgi:type IV secretory pathway TrbD component
VTRDRVLAWLTAVLVACVCGGLLAVPVTLALRNWLVADGNGSRAVVIGAGLTVWILASAVISAVWLRREARR